MTREDKLYSLKGDMLIAECDKLGVKVSCNKSRTQLKESKSKVVDRILAFEANTAEVEKTERKLVPMPGIEKLEELKQEFPRHKSAKVVALPDSIKKVTPKHENILDYVQDSVISLNMEFKRSSKSIRLFKTNNKIATIFARKSSIRVYMNNAKFNDFNFDNSIIERVNIDDASEINFYIQQDNIEYFLNKVMEDI